MNRYPTRKTFFPSLYSDKAMQKKSCILVLTYYSVFHVEHSAMARKGSLFLWIHSIRRPAGRKATLFATEIIQRPNTSPEYEKCSPNINYAPKASSTCSNIPIIQFIRRPDGRKATLFATEIIQRPNTSPKT